MWIIFELSYCYDMKCKIFSGSTFYTFFGVPFQARGCQWFRCLFETVLLVGARWLDSNAPCETALLQNCPWFGRIQRTTHFIDFFHVFGSASQASLQRHVSFFSWTSIQLKTLWITLFASHCEPRTACSYMYIQLYTWCIRDHVISCRHVHIYIFAICRHILFQTYPRPGKKIPANAPKLLPRRRVATVPTAAPFWRSWWDLKAPDIAWRCWASSQTGSIPMRPSRV